MSDRDRFWSKVAKSNPNGCWLWTAARDRDDYGMFWRAGRMHRAHRLAYEDAVEPISPGLQLDHLCRNHACVRPDHLEPVTGRENVLRGETPAAANAAKDRCPQDHPYDLANTYHFNGQRHCRACRRAAAARYRARKAGAVT